MVSLLEFSLRFPFSLPPTDCTWFIAPTIPQALFAAYQMMFAAIVPVVVTGACFVFFPLCLAIDIPPASSHFEIIKGLRNFTSERFSSSAFFGLFLCTTLWHIGCGGLDFSWHGLCPPESRLNCPLNEYLWNRGVLDFAGGLVIHATSGVAALVVALVLDPRPQDDVYQATHHNIPLTGSFRVSSLVTFYLLIITCKPTVVGGALTWAGE